MSHGYHHPFGKRDEAQALGQSLCHHQSHECLLGPAQLAIHCNTMKTKTLLFFSLLIATQYLGRGADRVCRSQFNRRAQGNRRGSRKTERR